jgi:hypothetical protein
MPSHEKVARLHVNILEILRDPAERRDLVVRSVIAAQAREGITTTREQAEAAYDKVFEEIDSQK